MDADPENPYAAPRGEAEISRVPEPQPDAMRFVLAGGILLAGTLALAWIVLLFPKLSPGELLLLGTIALCSIGCAFWLLVGKKLQWIGGLSLAILLMFVFLFFGGFAYYLLREGNGP